MCVDIFTHILVLHNPIKQENKQKSKTSGLLARQVSAKIALTKKVGCWILTSNVETSHNDLTAVWVQNRYNAFDAVSDPPKYYCQLLTKRRPDVNTDVTLLWNRFHSASDTAMQTLGAHVYVKT